MEFCEKVVKQALIDEVNGRQRNMASSPLSIAAVLRMLAVGSNGRTLEQLLGFLDCESLDNIKTSYSNLAAIAANGGEDGEGPLINFVNGLWFNQRYTLNPSFQQILTSVFLAETKSLDFENKPDEAVEEINSWVNNATKGLIPVMVEEETIEGALIIANALYFKGAWECAFDASLTRDFNFHLLNGEKVQASFMSSYENQFFRSFDSFKVVKLPYKHSSGGGDSRRFSMHVFLPNERDGLHKLLQEFNENPKLFLNQDLGLCWTSLARFLIPKFKFSYYFKVSPIMGDLGLNLGELTEMIEHPNGGSRVSAFRVPVIVQNSRIEVNEEGTEAAAETDCEDLGCCLDSMPPPLPSFVADHPFMFMIKEDTSATPFFIGILFNPLLD